MAKKRSIDGLTNVVSGLGTEKAKRSHNTFALTMLNSWQQLDAAYQTNWIARKIVDVRAQDMTREWRRIKCTDAEEIQRVESSLCIPQIVQEATQWARLYGGAGVLMLTGQDLTKPLRMNQIKKGSLQRVLVFDRWDLSAHTINTWDVLARNYLLPEYYTLRGGTQQIHHSHIVRFTGEKLPLRWMQHTQGWGDSVLRKCIDDIADLVASVNGIAELMQEANVDVITREGLTDDLASDQDEAIITRYELFSQMKSIVHTALLDENETYDRKTLQLSGVAPIIDLFMTWIAGAADTPLTKLFGTSAKGLNATGDGDLKTYYDSVRADQKSKLALEMRYLDEVMVRSATGRMPDDFDYEWNPLSQPNTVEVAQADQLKAQTDIIYLDAGVVQKSQVQRELQSNEQYQFNDEQIEELEELENANMFDEPTGEEESTQEFIDRWSADNSTFASVKLNKSTADKIHKHLSDVGIDDVIPIDDMHVTLMYSKNSKVQTDTKSNVLYSARIKGQPSIIGNDPWRALVVDLDSNELVKRHRELRDAGGNHSHDEFRPHLSLKYSPSNGDLQKLLDNPLQLDELIFAGETFEQVR